MPAMWLCSESHQVGSFQKTNWNSIHCKRIRSVMDYCTL